MKSILKPLAIRIMKSAVVGISVTLSIVVFLGSGWMCIRWFGMVNGAVAWTFAWASLSAFTMFGEER